MDEERRGVVLDANIGKEDLEVLYNLYLMLASVGLYMLGFLVSWNKSASILVFVAIVGIACATNDSCLTSGESNINQCIAEGQEYIAEGNWDMSIKTTDEGLAKYPDDPGLLCMKAYSLRKISKPIDAIALLNKAIAIEPNPVRFASRGYAYLARGNATAALMDAEKATTLDPSYATAYGIKALSCLSLGQINKAESAIEQALSLEPDSAHYWHIQGLIYQKQGNCTGAISAFRKSISLDPKYSLPWPEMPSAS